MHVFGTGVRGCFMEAKLNGEASVGATITVVGKQIPRKHDPYFVTNVGFAQKERFSVVQCFNDRNYVYAFGHDPMSSLLTIQFLAFLVDKGSSSGAALNSSALTNLTHGYAKGRLSKSLKRASVSIGAKVMSGFIVGMESSTVSPEYNLQGFSMSLLLAEPQPKYTD